MYNRYIVFIGALKAENVINFSHKLAELKLLNQGYLISVRILKIKFNFFQLKPHTNIVQKIIQKNFFSKFPTFEAFESLTKPNNIENSLLFTPKRKLFSSFIRVAIARNQSTYTYSQD